MSTLTPLLPLVQLGERGFVVRNIRRRGDQVGDLTSRVHQSPSGYANLWGRLAQA